MTRILITGDAGFIGYHLARSLLSAGHQVYGIDGMTSYYDPGLKRDRLAKLREFPGFTHYDVMLEELTSVSTELFAFSPQHIYHLAAQAGVRYSLEAPDAYLSSNILGSLRLLEFARECQPSHLLIASTSSAYGGNASLPFSELDRTAAPMSLYAATKIGAEALAHSFAHLWSIPTTCFRFFTVYGPWGRPDMALYRFVDNILEDRPIEVYGYGRMRRDFTYVHDLVDAVVRLSARPPQRDLRVSARDSLSPVAPYRTVNIAGGTSVVLNDYIEAIEEALGKVAEKRYLPVQPGDVVATSADPHLLQDLVGEMHHTPLREGVRSFVEWYTQYRR